jgi:thioredoxin 1
MKMEINDENFEEKVLETKEPTLVMFWGSWCPACKACQKGLEELKENVKNINIHSLNVDKNPKSSSKYEIAMTPTFQIFKDGTLVDVEFGARSQFQLEKWVRKYL